MNSKATIVSAKVGGSEYGRESTLTLTLDVRLPAPVETKSINEWAASELDWQTRQEIAQAQRQRQEGDKPRKLTKAEKKAQDAAHEQGDECGIAGCDVCNEQREESQFTCLAHSLLLEDCAECDAESAVFLDPEDVLRLREKYDGYAEGQRRTNQEALASAQEAALFLLLIKKPVRLSIAPVQQGFAELLQLNTPTS